MRVRRGFVDVEGHRLAYLAVNEHLARPEEPAVVFIHGVLASVNFWLDAVPPDFRDSRAWFALSLPAHHPSTVPEDFGPGQVDEQWFYRLMNGALQELLDGRKAVVVGHSTGGFCALNLAAHRSPSVVGIVSVAGFHRGEWGSVEGLLLRLAGLGKWAKPIFGLNIRIAAYSRFVQRVFSTLLAHDREAFRASPLSERMLENTGPDTRAQDPAALFTLFNGIGQLEIGDRLRDIRVPCHVFAGSHDPVVPTAQSRRIAHEVPGAESVVFEDVGHMPFMECTEPYYEALERALAEFTERSGSAATAAGSERRRAMTYPEYRADLQRIHESEVYGQAVFATAARLTRNPERKKKWLTLKALEDKTLARYLAYMRSTQQPVTEPTGWVSKGRVQGAALAVIPWRLAMKFVRDATAPFLVKFRRLERNANAPEREFFAYVVAHEEALEAFAKKELANEPESLKAVENLLAT